MTNWITADPDKPWEFLRFVADALERGEELECEWWYYEIANWCPNTLGSALDSLVRKSDKVRYRIKPKPLAPWWKPFTENVVLNPGDVVYRGDTQEMIRVHFNLKHSEWRSHHTHYARKEDLIHGTD
ncbi:MAG: hypothetical protein AAFW75_27140 [Cyanobacteria bacterium J06636_16]